MREHPAGAVFAAPLDVVLSEFDIVQPDLIYIAREHAAVLTEQHVRGAPDLVAEILSSGTRRIDETTKRRLYERFGVFEYWIVDPDLDTIKVYRRVGDQLVRLSELSLEHGDVVTTPLLPGFALALTDVFASAL